jgi:prolyl oligopeptidase PreP (S9A serine peptidase family)
MLVDPPPVDSTVMHGRQWGQPDSGARGPRTPDGYLSLAAMDPYHHVRPGMRYPAVLLQVALNDNRVSP